ncbi:MAG: acylphosphatase [Selenomonadaceae bacterium]
MLSKSILPLFMAILVFAAGLPVAEAGSSIDTIQVSVMSDGRLPPLIQKRMQASVQTIGEQLLSGRAISEAMDNKGSYENIIHEVFDKILVGYSVENVKLNVAENTHITVNLLPWSDVIRSVNVVINVEGMPTKVAQLALKDMAGVESVFEETLIGLPVDATDWSNGVLKRSLNDFMAKHLPEFRADFEMETDRVTKVKLVVYPKVPVVRSVDLSMRSDTMPNLTMLGHRQLMQEKVDIMLGVPVAFVARHADTFQKFLQETLDSTWDFKTYGMHTKVTLQPGEKTTVISRSNSEWNKFRIEGWVDIGRKNQNDNTMFRTHIGRMLSQQDEIFVFADVYPQDIKWNFSTGYVRSLSTNLQAMIRYDLNNHCFIIGGEKKFNSRWLLRYEYRWADAKGEAAVRYKMHDFLSLEYAVDNDENWLRLIGNF